MNEFPKSSDKECFVDYIYSLRLTHGDLQKTILDVGSGSGEFAAWAKEAYGCSQIFSLEPIPQLLEKTKGIQGRAEAIPFKDDTFELVISNASIPNVFLGESYNELKDKVRNCLFELMRVIKPGGEIRLGRVLKGDVYQSQRELVSVFEETLEELKQKYCTATEKISHPAGDIYETRKDGTLILLAQAYLIKIRKP